MTRLDVDAAVDHLRARARRPHSGPWPMGAPTPEYLRSPAAGEVGVLSAREGLFAFHIEHRHHLELPEAWCGAQDVDVPTWSAGVLPESKYQSFRHEHPVASFHPTHQAKWGTHELCHALVGFAWKPDATPLFHATAARLSELLPVALWYFFDEAFLARCADHAGQGALFKDRCVRCEQVAGSDADDPHARGLIEAGLRFVRAELDAVARTRACGRPVPHRYASLNLCTDGLAYAHSHGARLRSEGFAMWVERYAVAGAGWWQDLDSLVGRVEAVCRSMLTGAPLDHLVPDAGVGRDLWTRQDVGSRLLQVWEDCEGECADGVLALADQLAEPGSLRDVVAGYRALEAEWVLPAPEQLFAVGYPLVDGLGSDTEQLTAGVRSSLPQTSRALAADLAPLVQAWAAADSWERRGIGRRFAEWFARHRPGPLADAARYESAVNHPPVSDVALARLLGRGSDPERLTAGVELLVLDHHPDGSGPASFLVARDGDEALLVEVDPSAGGALMRGEAVSDATMADLRELGLVTSARWTV